ncbi:MAG: transposase [Acidobacteriota bacterium]
MKLTLQIQLLPDKRQAAEMRKTIEAFNEACNWLAGQAFKRQTANKVLLQKLFYSELRSRFLLSAQMAVRCIAQVSEAFKRDKSIRPRFRPHAAIPLDQRLMGFKSVSRVSIRTLEGRIIVGMIMGAYQRERFTMLVGQSDLVLRKDGKWFLLVTVSLPDGAPIPATDFLGVDLGVKNIATTSDGEKSDGEEVEKVRQKYHRQRQSLQQRAARQKQQGRRPKNVRRKLKKISQRESRFRRQINHQIAKAIVEEAKGSGRGIALEDLKGIRTRVTFRRQQRARMAGWSFYQLRVFIEYKARLIGVVVVTVDPRNTSRTCSECGYCDKANRRSQSEFVCLSCGHSEQADVNAAKNIRLRAKVDWPTVSESQEADAA